MKISVGSVCSGIEAASVAWLPLGFEFKWLSEIAAFPSKLLAEKYPDVPNLGDMNHIPAMIADRFIFAPDIVCGGTPCQAFSNAGWQKGLQDERGNLTLKFAEIVNANDAVRRQDGKKQTVIFWENVEGVLSDKTNAFGLFISSLAGLKKTLPMKNAWPTAGFLKGPKRTVAWRVLDAKYFGIPQQRRRLYVVAGEDALHPEMILFEKHNPCGIQNEYPTNPDALSFEVDGHRFTVFRAYTDCLFSSYATKWNGNASANNGSLFVVQDNSIRRISPLECERLMGFPDGYTNIRCARKSNRYQALGNSWAVPVIKWIGERIRAVMESCAVAPYFSSQSNNDLEYYDLSEGIVELASGNVLNCSEKPEKCILGSMKAVVTADDVPDIYLSPVGCAGIVRRSKERQNFINPRLLEVLEHCASTMDETAIEKRSRIQRRGKYSANSFQRKDEHGVPI